MAKIKELSPLDKPREKAERFGIEQLSDEELLALIINSGTVGVSSLDIARNIMHEAHYLNELLNQPYQYFKSFKGVKNAKALKLAAVMEIVKRINQKQRLIYEKEIQINSDSIFKRYQAVLAPLKQETMIVIILNKNKRIIYETNLYKGNANTLSVSHKEILRLLLLYNGAFFYLIHNHPQSSLSPSEADIIFTKNIKEKSEQIDIKLIDHLIICQNGYYSFLKDSAFVEEDKLI